MTFATQQLLRAATLAILSYYTADVHAAAGMFLSHRRAAVCEIAPLLYRAADTIYGFCVMLKMKRQKKKKKNARVYCTIVTLYYNDRDLANDDDDDTAPGRYTQKSLATVSPPPIGQRRRTIRLYRNTLYIYIYIGTSRVRRVFNGTTAPPVTGWLPRDGRDVVV